MTTRITQVDGQAGKITALRVEGSMRLADAELLEATYLELQATQKSPITIDLAGTNFLDSDSASILCRLKRRGVELIGLHYFVQQIIQAAENELHRIRSQVMQRTTSFNTLSKFFLIAVIALTAGSVYAQSTDDKPIQRERVGVEAADALPLTLNEAIRFALENNNDIRTSRIDVEKAEYSLTASRGAYDPRIFSETYFERSSTPVASFLGGNSSGSLKQKDFTSRAGLSGLAPKFGGSYQFDLSSTRLSSNNFFNALDPAISSRFSFSYTQPLVRGRKTDDTRRKIEIAKKNLTLTDVQFRQRATDVITRVEHAYWELVHALKSLQVQSEAVKQTRAQVETNKRQVAQGVLAPIDVVEAEAQVKIYEQNVYAAQEEVTRAENQLKTLMLPDRTAQHWSRALLPVTPVNLEAPRMFLSDAIQTALDNRFELVEIRTSKDINEINKRFYRDQTKPQVDLQVSYTSNGYAGTLTDNDNPILNGLTSLERRVAELSTLAGLPVLPSSTFNTIPADLQGGYGRAWSNLLGQDNPTVRVGVRISLLLKNRTGWRERLAVS